MNRPAVVFYLASMFTYYLLSIVNIKSMHMIPINIKEINDLALKYEKTNVKLARM